MLQTFINLIYKFFNKLVFVSDKIFKHSLTNTSILQKFVNYGQKKFYNIGFYTIKDYKWCLYCVRVVALARVVN
jgi:hypothetical protein